MPVFILLSTLTGEGVESLKRNPSRVQQVNAQVEAMGARILDQWAVLGPYDFVTVVEAPDLMTIARISVEIGARGSTKIQTLPAMHVPAFLDALGSSDAYD